MLVRGAGFPFALLDSVFRSETPDHALRHVAADPKFREAVTWQNRPAVGNALDCLLRHAGARNARTRRQQLLVARYLQRFCAKNDTIGFFGPVGWATVGGEPCFDAGPTLIADRGTFFEPWAVLALARTVEDEAKLDAPVTLAGDLRLNGTKLLSSEGTLTLTPNELALVRIVNGCSAAELLRRLGDTAVEQALWREMLQPLVSRNILRWEFPVSISLDPARQWRATSGAQLIEELTEKRAAVSDAAGDPLALNTSLQELENAFEARARVAARRPADPYRWGRNLVFEECRRAISMDLGRVAIERVAPALTILLQVARWYTFSISVLIARSLATEFQRSGFTPLHVFWRRTQYIFDEETVPALESVRAQFRERWKELWSLAEVRDREQHLDIKRANEFIKEHFPAPCPGWPGARHHAPDLMWDAPTPEALLAGAGTPVLSELHPGVTPFTTLSVLSLCPVIDELRSEWETDFPESLISPIPWEDFARSTQDARLAKHHWHLDFGDNFASDLPANQVLRVADFDVVSDEGRPVAVHQQSGMRFDLLRIFERRMRLRAAAVFSLSDTDDFGPRRYLGPVVVQRAHWRVESLPFAEDVVDRDARAAAWREELGLPERVFVRVPHEQKPIYVDLTSPLSTEMLVRFARGASCVSISEMYPGPEGLWLRDREGHSYTSEVRLIAVDPEPFDEQKVWAAAAVTDCSELSPSVA